LSATALSAALQRGGTIYVVHNPQPIGEWFSAADNKNSVVGTLHVVPSDVPQHQGAAP
jgi:tRNA1(Val) A37 N6-methylase TrmN6